MSGAGAHVMFLVPLLALPTLLLLFVPYFILANGWGYCVPEHQMTTFRFFGAAPIAFGGISIMWSTFDLLITGNANVPINAVDNTLKCAGMYRYTRNPIYGGVILALAGESLLFVSGTILIITLLSMLSLHLWVILYEEPYLRSKFGQLFSLFCAKVPRWVPETKSILEGDASDDRETLRRLGGSSFTIGQPGRHNQGDSGSGSRSGYSKSTHPQPPTSLEAAGGRQGSRTSMPMRQARPHSMSDSPV